MTDGWEMRIKMNKPSKKNSRRIRDRRSFWTRSPLTVLSLASARLKVTVLAAMLGLLVLGVGPAGASGYDTCTLSYHCYALSVFDPGPILNSTYSQLVTITDNVPNYTSDFADDEMWTSWNNERWVELGDTTGESYGQYGAGNAGPNTPYAFQASQTALGYYEYDYTNIQPGLGNWYSVRSAADLVGSQWTWYSYFDEIGPWGANGVTPSRLASEVENGLEMTNNHITNHGESRYSEWQNSEGTWYAPWEYGSTYGYRLIKDEYGDDNPPTCAAPSAEGNPGTVAWYAARQPVSCWSTGHGPGADLSGPLGPEGGALQDVAEPPPAVPAGANGNIVVPYTAPSGPLLSSSQLTTIATIYATHAGDPTPSEIQAVKLPRSEALTAANGIYPKNATGALASWLSAESDVIELHGNFTLTDAPHPPHTSAPTGHIMTIVVDAHTGERIARAVTETTPANLATFGAVENL